MFSRLKNRSKTARTRQRRETRRSTLMLERLEDRQLLCTTPPVLSLSDGNASYIEDSAAQSIDSAANVGFTCTAGGTVVGTLTAEIKENAHISDRITLRESSDLDLINNAVMMKDRFGSFTKMGEFRQGDYLNDFEFKITNGIVTPAHVQTVLRHVTFESLGHHPTTETRTIEFQFLQKDPVLTSATQTRQVQVLSRNDRPVLDTSADIAIHVPGGPTVIDAGFEVSDTDSANFGGGVLTALISDNAHSGDTIGVRHAGGGDGQIGVAGTQISYEGNVIGTVASNSTSTRLMVNLNGVATPAATQALTRAITFDTSSGSNALREVTYTLNDGDGGLSAAETQFINVSAIAFDGYDEFVQVSDVATTPPRYVGAADLNGDGTDALLTEKAAQSPIVADFNRDGHDDVLRFDDRYNVKLQIGNGNGGFARTLNVSSAVNQAMGIGDVNGDGYLDVAFTHAFSALGRALTVMTYDGDSSFRKLSSYVIPSEGLSVDVGDVNGDGFDDIVVAVQNGELRYFIGRGDGSVSPGLVLDRGDSRGYTDLHLDDLNADGFADLLFADPANDEIWVGLNNHNETFSFDEYAVPGVAVSLALGDINRDGSPDIVTAERASNTNNGGAGGNVSLLANDGEGNFTLTGTFAAGPANDPQNFPSDVALGDLNADGLLDIGVGHGSIRNCFDDGGFRFCRGTDSTYATTLTAAVSEVSTSTSVSGFIFDDANGDGVQNGSDAGRSGVTVYVDTNNNAQRDSGESSTTTNADGEYTFIDLPAGDHVVRQVLTVGREQTSPSQASLEVYVLSGGDAQTDSVVVNAFDAIGHEVTLGVASHEWDGSQQNLAGFDAVVLLNNHNWNAGRMPAAGQDSLVSFVEDGGALVASEWVMYNTRVGRYPELAPVWAADYTGFVSGSETSYSRETPNPLLDGGVDASFALDKNNLAGSEATIVPKSGATAFYSSSDTGQAGLIGWDYEGGRVMNFSTLVTHQEMQNDSYRALLTNSVAWASRWADDGAQVVSLASGETISDVNFSSTGSAPEMDLFFGNQPIADGDTTPVAAEGTYFGAVWVDDGTVDRTFTIRNSGNDTLRLTGSPRVRFIGGNLGDFTVVSGPNATVAVDGETWFTIRFDPRAEGLRSTTVSIANNDGNENTYDFLVRGIARAPQNSPPTLSDLQDGVSVEDARLSGLPFTIGDEQTPVGDLTVSATSSNPALVRDENIRVIGAGAERRFEITPEPNAFGQTEITVRVTDGDGDQTSDSFTLTVNPINDPPTRVTLDNSSVQENASGATVGRLIVADVDDDQHSITSSDGRFVIEGNRLRLRPEQQLDHETEPTVTMTLTVTDPGGASLVRDVTITVTDVNEPTSSQIRASLRAVDVDGQSITQVRPSQEFFVQLVVEDIRDNPEGVFAAYVDLGFDPSVVTLGNPIDFSNRYSNAQHHETTAADELGEVGAFASNSSPAGAGEFVVFSVPFTAGSGSGEVNLSIDGADVIPERASLLYGSETPVAESAIEFVPLSIDITDPFPWQNPANNMDVNNDGLVVPLDVLILINHLNEFGPHELTATTSSPPPFLDVNGDNTIAPIDVLIVINRLNDAATAEGETVGIFPDSPSAQDSSSEQRRTAFVASSESEPIVQASQSAATTKTNHSESFAADDDWLLDDLESALNDLLANDV